MLSQVPVGCLSAPPGLGSSHPECLGSRHGSSELCPTARCSSLGMAGGTGCFVCMLRAWHLKNAEGEGECFAEETKEELPTFNIPGLRATPPYKPLPHFLPPAQNNSIYLTFPNLFMNKGHQCWTPHCKCSKYCWLRICPEGILG